MNYSDDFDPPFFSISLSQTPFMWLQNFPNGSSGKDSAYSAGNTGSVPGLGRSPGEGNDSTLQDSYLGNPMDRGAWWATIHEVPKE